jgi:hypothetical protein
MGWMQIVGAAVGALRGYTRGSVEKAQIEANNRLNAAEAGAANQVRGASNAFAAARGALTRYMQSVNNNRTLDAGGAALESNLVNARRREDLVQSARFEDQIRDSEQTGAQAAAAAFAGVGGDAADMVSLSTRLSQQRAAAAASTAQGQRLFDTSRRAEAVHRQMVGSLDTSLVFDSIDYQTNVAIHHQALSPGYLALAGAVDSFAGSGGLTQEKSTQTRGGYSAGSYDYRNGSDIESDKAERFQFGENGSGNYDFFG